MLLTIHSKINMPDITTRPEIIQPEPNPAREIPDEQEPVVYPEDSSTGSLA
ncbi:MAG: hypothetical protein N3B21_06835 [Clostridia bacterium]|nr:hypothetical protein [Clostridia bacterium]